MWISGGFGLFFCFIQFFFCHCEAKIPVRNLKYPRDNNRTSQILLLFQSRYVVTETCESVTSLVRLVTAWRGCVCVRARTRTSRTSGGDCTGGAFSDRKWKAADATESFLSSALFSIDSHLKTNTLLEVGVLVEVTRRPLCCHHCLKGLQGGKQCGSLSYAVVIFRSF